MPMWQRIPMCVWGNLLRAPTFDRWLYLLLHRIGMMGRADRNFLMKLLQPGMTVVDVGANQGLYTLLFSQSVGPSGRVLAFEPDDRLYAALETNLANNKILNVRTFHCALGAERGTLTLYRSLLNSGDNRLASNERTNASREGIRIRVDALDSILIGERIDFVKIDVQGWEMNVFRGMESMLNDLRHNKLTIYFEYWPQGLKNAGDDPTEVLRFLDEKGFLLYQLVGSELQEISNIAKFAASVKPSAYLNLYASRGQPVI